VTLVAVWLGWNVNVVRHRRALLAALGPNANVTPLEAGSIGQDYSSSADDVIRVLRDWGRASKNCKYFPPTKSSSLSWLRFKLGDQPYLMISTDDPKDAPEIRRWYLEAICVVNESSSSEDWRLDSL
jgi:hypothetical protein